MGVKFSNPPLDLGLKYHDLSPTLILTADHSTLLFLPGVFYKIKNFFFLLWVNLYMITDTYLHDPPPFNGPFFTTPPFSAVSKSCDPPLFPPPSPLLISDKSLMSSLLRLELKSTPPGSKVNYYNYLSDRNAVTESACTEPGTK